MACETHVYILCRRVCCFLAPPSGLRVSSFKRFCSHQWPASRRYLPNGGSAAGSGPPLSKARFSGATAQPDCMGFAQHRPCREPKFYPGNASQGSEEGSAAPGSFPTHHEVHLNCFGVMLRIDSRNALPSGQRGRITVPAKHFFSEILRLPGTGIAKMRLDFLGWPILGLFLKVMLGLCWPILAPCWTIPSGLRGTHSIFATLFL